jgi:hypothetical protein
MTYTQQIYVRWNDEIHYRFGRVVDFYFPISNFCAVNDGTQKCTSAFPSGGKHITDLGRH